MTMPSKTSSLQAYNMMLYRKALHPEFFAIEGRRRLQHSDYEIEAWIFKGGHSLRFQHNGVCVSEVITDHCEHLPERGLVATLPCAGEKDHEAEFADRVIYMTSMQTEILPDHLYLGTYNEMLEHGRQCDGLLALWKDEGEQMNNLSLLDVQRFRHEVHMQAYHLRADCGLVLRTQSIYQLKEAGESI